MLSEDSSEVTAMNIQIDDKLLREAMTITGHLTERSVVEAGLRVLIRFNKQARVRQLKGKNDFESEALTELIRETERLGLYDNPPSSPKKS